MIELDHVTKRWGCAIGVEDLDLQISPGSFVVLLGPSGCGKSTALRLMAGLDLPDAGRVVIGGADVTAKPPSQRGISMVFQSYALFPHLNVADNITFGLKVRRVPRAERKERLRKILGLVGLQGLECRKPAELSGGQRQRVALARALIAGHPACLMDEPLSNLDAKLRHAVRQDIRAMQRELGLTIVYVTHDQTEAMGMADRVALMRAGRIEQVGTPTDLYEHPTTVFAATFVGSPPMVIVPADSVPTNLLPEPEESWRAQDCLLGIRPEHLQILPYRRGLLSGRVRNIEFLGAETLVYLSAPMGEMIARVAGDARYEPGALVGLRWLPEQAHLFARNSQRRIKTRVTGGDRGTVARAASPAGLG